MKDFDLINDNLIQITKDQMSLILKNSVFTGSRAFGFISNKYSDYDYVIVESFWDFLNLGVDLEDAGYCISEIDGDDSPDIYTVKVEFGDKLINLIVVKTMSEKEVWESSTHLMASLLINSKELVAICKIREYRLNIFHQFRRYYRDIAEKYNIEESL